MDPITLQELLNQLADGANLAELLRRYSDEGNLTAEQIATLRTEATAAFREIQGGERLTEANIAELEAIADVITSLNGEDAHLTEQAEAIASRAAEVAARAGVVDAEPEADGDADGETDADPETDGEEANVVAEAEAVTEAAATEPVAASASTPARRRRVDLAAVNRRANARPNPVVVADAGEERQPLGGALIASAEAQGVRAGHVFGSWAEAGGVFGRMIQGVQTSSLLASAVDAGRTGREFYERSGLLQLHREHSSDLIVTDPKADSTALLRHAVDPTRLADGYDSLTAAAGWCAPSETLYELCELPCALEGILSMPEIGAPRGGVRWTKGLDFCDIYNAAGYFHYTEAELMATPAPTKPCMEIPCVDFDECRLEVDGMCIVGDIPQARAYPEVVSQFLQGATCARAHRTNALKIGRIVVGSINDGVVEMCGGATASLLSAIELKVQEYRYRGLRAQTGNVALLEMPLPFWVRGVIRGDLANRRGYADPFNVTDEQINRWFASIGVVPRWVYDWQPLPQACAVPPAAPVTAWPTQVDIVLYEVGTWVWATQDVITLENLYDSTLIRQNKFTALFVEDAFCLIQRCNDSRRFQVPVCPNGAVGAEVTCDCGAAPFAPALVAAELEAAKLSGAGGVPLPDGFRVETDEEREEREFNEQLALEQKRANGDAPPATTTES